MIAIEENIIYRDSEKIGQIVGTVAWMNAKQAGRIIGQIKQAANIEGLTFEIVDTPEEVSNLEALPVVKDSLTIPDSFPRFEKTIDAVKAHIESSRISALAQIKELEPFFIPTDKDSLTVETLSAPEVVDNPPASEPAVSCDDLAAGTFHIPSDFGSYEENPKHFAQCFINTYGPHGYDAWLKQKEL